MAIIASWIDEEYEEGEIKWLWRYVDGCRKSNSKGLKNGGQSLDVIEAERVAGSFQDMMQCYERMLEREWRMVLLSLLASL